MVSLVKLTAKVKLQPTREQHKLLLDTLEAANAACNSISQIAFKTATFHPVELQKICYSQSREGFRLGAQMTVRCISKVADAYKVSKQAQCVFNAHGAIAYDLRILRWYTDKQTVSIWTLDGRLFIRFVTGEKQLELLKKQKGQSDLAYRNGEFYLLASCEVEEPELEEAQEVLGVDLGIVNLATDSDGNSYSGSQVRSLRKRRRRQRKRLQAKGTKSAKRVLKRLSGRERRFARNENHRIAKQIVKTAKDTKRAIALEKLKGIRKRTTVRKRQRDDLHSWAFDQLIRFILYRARLAGVKAVEVDPRNTSRRCSKCGYVSRNNRKTQDRFSCGRCHLALNADYNAACNIGVAGWGLISGPDESSDPTEGLTGSSPRFYRG